MRLARSASAALVVLAATAALSCREAATPATFEARTLRPAKAARPLVVATYFPSTAPRARRREVPILVIAPVLFRREILYWAPDRGLIAYLQQEGFPVWLLWTATSPAPNARDHARGIAEAAAAIAGETGIRRFDLLGLSLGAEATLRALEPLTAPGSPVAIRRVVFLGGAFDFAYPHSFGSRIAPVRGGPAAALCSLGGDVGCAREFRRPDAAVPWLGAIPRADDDALAPSLERFPFVKRFARLPVLFVDGKVDGVSPSEATYPLYRLWGADEPDPSRVPKLFFLAGRENALGWDFDHFDLFAGSHATDVWSHVVTWLTRDD